MVATTFDVMASNAVQVNAVRKMCGVLGRIGVIDKARRYH